MLTSLDSFNVEPTTLVTDEYLDITKLEEGRTYTKVAYVHNTSFGMSQSMSGFVRFFLKDCNAKVIVARLFDVEDFMFSGAKQKQFKGRLVEITFVVQVFNGTLSLVIDGSKGVQLVEREVDMSLFRGKVPFDKSFLDAVTSKLGYDDGKIPEKWLTESFENLGEGRTGAFAALASATIAMTVSLPWLEKKQIQEIMRYGYLTFSGYFDILTSRKKQLLPDDSAVFVRVMNTLAAKYNLKPDEMSIVGNCVGSLVNTSKPVHYYAHCIKKAYLYNESMLEYDLALDTIPAGCSTSIRNEQLANF